MVTAFFKILSPFIDPVTKSKLKFNESLRQHVPPEQLVHFAGGDVKWEYDHEVYWPALIQLAEHRRNAYKERWVQAGKKIGESEHYLRARSEQSVGAGDNSTDIEKGVDGLKLDKNSDTEGSVTATA